MIRHGDRSAASRRQRGARIKAWASGVEGARLARERLRLLAFRQHRDKMKRDLFRKQENHSLMGGSKSIPRALMRRGPLPASPSGARAGQTDQQQLVTRGERMKKEG
jgi:hypothetical protein